MAELILSADGICHAVLVRIPTDKDRIFIVPGWPFKHAGFEEFSFVLHKSIQSDDDWVAAEATTGSIVATGEDMNDAMDMAGKRLTKAGIDKVRASLEKAKAVLIEKGIPV